MKEANLKPFQPGQSGNPGGRPKGRSITSILREKLAEPAKGKRGKTKAEAIADVVIEQALAGDPRFLREILERTEGKVTQTIQVSDADYSKLSDDELRAIAGREGGG